jgi:hypothetical protein
MKTRSIFILGIIMMLGAGVAAAHVVVISPPVHMDVASGEISFCMALNVSEDTLDATLQVFNSIGQLQGSAHTDPALPPRHMIAIEPGLAALNDSFATCQLTSTAGKKGDFLMTLCVIGGPAHNTCQSTVTAQ